MPKCPQCDNGYEIVRGDNGMPIESPCYHCANTGTISEEQEIADRLESAAKQIGSIMAEEERKKINSDPDGDGYALHAAEEGMSTYDYQNDRAWHFFFQAQTELMKMDERIRNKVVDLVLSGDRG
jgi:hypothetical protein